MRLLCDQNLSSRLVAQLDDLFAGSLHVGQVGLDRADNATIWRFARDNGFAIVTKGSDFQERNQIAGSAPRVVRIRRGNCSTQDMEAMLREYAPHVSALEQEADNGFLVLL